VSSSTYQINAQDDWTYKFTVNPGQRATMGVNPSGWTWDPNRSSVGAGGTGQTNPNMPDPNAPQACLLYQRRGTQPELGYWPANSAMIGAGPGDYFFRINDDKLGDNSGNLILYVSFYAG
jgi:hypothetical protein